MRLLTIVTVQRYPDMPHLGSIAPLYPENAITTVMNFATRSEYRRGTSVPIICAVTFLETRGYYITKNRYGIL